jgi:NADPH:quinone reductase-like Zn-dependent oxidoreductase
MRAVILGEFGPPEVLVPTTVADPVPGPGQVLIDVAYANVTFVETQVRAGQPPNPAMLRDCRSYPATAWAVLSPR